MEHDNNANMPVAFTVTNEMLYEMIKDFKSDVNRGFDDVRALIKEETRQREKLEERMEQRMDRFEFKLNEVYESRKFMTIRFTTGWAFASFFMAVVSAGMVMAFGRGL